MGEALTVRALRSAALISLLLLDGCRREGEQRALFKLLTPAQTGVRFANTITTSDSLNAQTDPYVYNGGGVAIGDIDNDGLPDIFFTGNMVSSRVYVNKGKMRFEDITQPAGVTTTRWATGATMVDINNDGYLDIYFSISGPERSKPEERANLLFINNGDHTFTEAAARYGIADTSFTTHAVFLDYNGDGYLDLFLLNNSPKDFARGAADTHPLGVRSNSPGGYSKLYRNNGDGTFTGVAASRNTGAGRVWTRRRGRRRERRRLARHLRFQRRRPQRRPLHQQPRWDVHRPGRRLSQAYDFRWNGRRYRRFQ